MEGDLRADQDAIGALERLSVLLTYAQLSPGAAQAAHDWLAQAREALERHLPAS